MPNNTGNNRNPDGTFKAGVSGNPKGRPKGSFAIADILRRVGEEDVPEELQGKVEGLFDIKDIKDMQLMEGLLRLVFMYAIRGKSWAVQFIAERLEGKPMQPMSIETHDPIKLIETGTILDDRNKPNGVKNGVKNGVLNGG